MDYIITNKTYVKELSSEPLDKIEAEIGDIKQPEFYPQVKIKRWDNEVNFSARLVHDEASPIIDTDTGRIVWQGEKVDAEFYEIDDHEQYPHGAYEFNVILKEKPISNEVVFTIRTKGLEFYHQDELTEQEIADGCTRPENVVNSYAVYYKDCPLNYEGGKLYRSGKVGHIYRPLITDANNNQVWGALSINEEDETLTITIPQDYLDGAAYPIIVDPTFGYTTGGASSVLISNTIAHVGEYSYQAGNDTVTKISAYGYPAFGGTEILYFGIYEYSTGTSLPTNKLYSTSRSFTGTVAWRDTLTLSQALTNGTYYVCAVARNSSGSGFNIHYDTASTTNRAIRDSTNYMPTTWSGATNITNRISMYATYTTAATTIKTVDGLDYASVKTVNGLAVGSIKKINGVS